MIKLQKTYHFFLQGLYGNVNGAFFLGSARGVAAVALAMAEVVVGVDVSPRAPLLLQGARRLQAGLVEGPTGVGQLNGVRGVQRVEV